MIVDELVCGFLVTIEQLAKFADLELQPLPKTRSGFIVRTLQWLRKQPAKLHPIDVYYPRDKDPRTAPYRILFPTRGRLNTVSTTATNSMKLTKTVVFATRSWICIQVYPFF